MFNQSLKIDNPFVFPAFSIKDEFNMIGVQNKQKKENKIVEEATNSNDLIFA